MLIGDLRQKLKDGADLDTLKSIMNELRGALVLLQQAARSKEAAGFTGEEGYEEGEGGYDQGGYDQNQGYDQQAQSGQQQEYSYGTDYGEEDLSGYTASGEEVVDAEYRSTDE